MPHLSLGDLHTYYELTGSGPPLVFVHGGFVDNRMWDAQVAAFAQDYRVLRYDLRGHGLTGPSEKRRYTMELFAEDLRGLLDALRLERVALCGLSFGGMVAQAFAARYPERLSALILADTAVSTTLTWSDKLQTYLLAPRWVMLPTIRLLGVKRWVGFSFWLASQTRNADWFGADEAVSAYVKGAMLTVTTAEYVKLYGAIYSFRQQDLIGVTVPTLLLNGEKESESVLAHTAQLERLIPHAEVAVVPGAGHTSNMENAAAFNALLRGFLERAGV